MFEGKEVKVLLAGAGTGKTTRLLQYVDEELKVRLPDEIAFVTYTRKGVQEGLSRVITRYNMHIKDFPYFRTIHSLAFHALGLKQANLFGLKHGEQFHKKYGYTLFAIHDSWYKPAFSRDNKTTDDMYLEYYDLERSGALTLRHMQEYDIDKGYYRSFVHDYEEYKADKCLVDFCDCLIHYVQKGVSLPCKVAYVDECQDLSLLQWKVVEKAFANAEKIFVAGDDKQSIYKYNGARPDILIDLSKQYPVERLDHSYRIPLSVQRIADAVTSFIAEKSEQRLEPSKENGEGYVAMLADTYNLKPLISYDEWKGLAYAKTREKVETSWYLLSRNKKYFKRYTNMLEDNLIPYWTDDGFFMQGEVLKRIDTYLSIQRGAEKDETKKAKFMKRYGVKDITKPFTDCSLFDDHMKWVYYSYIEHYGMTAIKEMCKQYPQIYVGTIHSVKGGEAENVAVLMDISRKTMSSVFEDIDDELRCLYVAATRAKKNLYLIASESKNSYEDIVATLKHVFNLQF